LYNVMNHVSKRSRSYAAFLKRSSSSVERLSPPDDENTVWPALSFIWAILERGTAPKEDCSE